MSQPNPLDLLWWCPACGTTYDRGHIGHGGYKVDRAELAVLAGAARRKQRPLFGPSVLEVSRG